MKFNDEFDKKYGYNGNLGVIYSEDNCKFILWAPTAKEVQLVLYGNNGYEYNCKPTDIYTMNKGVKGTWEIELSGNFNGYYYNYLVNVNGEINEVVDPYAKAVGVNGNRGMIIDLSITNPNGWENDIKPKLKSATDSIIYEAHIRDLSIDESSGIKDEYKGKFKALTILDSCIPGTNVKTVVNHIKDMGFTHIHLLPAFDYGSVDETKLDQPQFNWGYDPKNYNVPEGSYSTNPYLGNVRIKEFKEMVKALHEAGIRVVMDVVYNHMYDYYTSAFERTVPGYYFRKNQYGEMSNGSWCGNDLESRHQMVRRYIKDMCLRWQKLYGVDGFRFDLMGIIDIETLNQVYDQASKIDDSFIMYGEGWNMPTAMDDHEKGMQDNHCKMQLLLRSPYHLCLHESFRCLTLPND